MKTFLSFLALVTTVFAFDPEVAKQIRQDGISVIERCAKKLSSDPSDVADILIHKIPSSRDGKCLFFCLYKSYSLLGDDGSYQLDIFIEKNLVEGLDPELKTKFETIVRNCQSSPPDADHCIYAVNIAKCVRNEQEKLGLAGIGIE